jgi:hypothetical protein
VRRHHRVAAGALSALAVFAGALLLTAAPAAAAEAPRWNLTVTPSTDYFIPGSEETTFYTIQAEDTGGPTSTSEQLVLEDTPPAGLPADAVHLYLPGSSLGLSELSERGLCPTATRCEYPGPPLTATGDLTAGSDTVSALIAAEGAGTLTAGSPVVAGVTVAAGRFTAGQPITGAGIPAGTSITAVAGSSLTLSAPVEAGATATGVTLTAANALPSVHKGQKFVMQVRVPVPPGSAPTAIEDTARVSSGGGPSAQAAASNQISEQPVYGLHSFKAPLTGPSAQPYTQAGGHPYQFTTEFNLATASALAGESEGWGEFGGWPVHDPQSLTADLPAGLIVNPQAVPTCELARFFADECPISTIVGTLGFRDEGHFSFDYGHLVPLYNLQPAGAYPGELGYEVGGVPFVITADLHGSDYAIVSTGLNLAPTGITHSRITLWGVPAEHAHDAVRGKACSTIGAAAPVIELRIFNNPDQQAAQERVEQECALESPNNQGPFPAGGPAETPAVPFVTMPTACPLIPKPGGEPGEEEAAPLLFGARSIPWGPSGEEATATTTDPGVDGCGELRFEPTIEARPTTNLADSPSGLDFVLKVPQNTEGPEGKEDPNGLATANLKEAVVKLPPGLVVNPSSGAGLEGCSEAQVGILSAAEKNQPAHCPDASRLGTVEVKTALLHGPLQGSVYLATPHQNPSGNLLAGYIVLEGEGIIIKLAGQFQTNKETGQITASFLENPQTPFEEFKFQFFEGARGALRTPAVCGTYTTTATLTPFSAPESGPPAEPAGEFETTAGPTGGACPNAASQEPHSPVFHAGTESPQAGIYSPFSLKLVRQDGEQEIKGIETTLPKGLIGKLAGVSYCPDAALAAAASKSGQAEQQSPSCPVASEVGSVDVAAGAGPTPLNVPGKAYLAGPYKGAPLSLAIITPAVAGPFDLGTVVVRTALLVNPITAQITAKSDPIPTILEGIPLDVRSITLKMARPNFTLNPTNCEPLAITGTALSALGATTALNQRFQVGGCQALPFKPSLKISLKGSTKHAGHPALEATVTYPQGGPYANIASAQVSLPHSEFIDQGNLNKTCTRPVLLEGKCPATSVYGKAKAWTPLLEAPLEGPVYLVGGFGYKLPALVAELDGQIRVLLVGKVDSDKEKGIRNTFEAVPDAPVSRFVLQMKGGKNYSLLENSENICAKPQKAKATFTAQSGKVAELEPTIANSCKKGKKHGKGHKHGRGNHKHGRPQQRALLSELGLKLW